MVQYAILLIFFIYYSFFYIEMFFFCGIVLALKNRYGCDFLKIFNFFGNI